MRRNTPINCPILLHYIFTALLVLIAIAGVTFVLLVVSWFDFKLFLTFLDQMVLILIWNLNWQIYCTKEVVWVTCKICNCFNKVLHNILLPRNIVVADRQSAFIIRSVWVVSVFNYLYLFINTPYLSWRCPLKISVFLIPIFVILSPNHIISSILNATNISNNKMRLAKGDFPFFV